MDQFVQQCRAKIAQHGHMVAAVGSNEQTGASQYAYTIGVSKYRGFEFAISGLPVEDMHNSLNTLAYKAIDRKLTPAEGLLVEGVFEGVYLPRLHLADPSWPFGLIASALDTDAKVPVWQAQFPTVDHKYPGDDGYTIASTVQTVFSLPRDA
jgi:hypothetical protein